MLVRPRPYLCNAAALLCSARAATTKKIPAAAKATELTEVQEEDRAFGKIGRTIIWSGGGRIALLLSLESEVTFWKGR